MKKMKNKEYRMYGLVPFHLSGIQSGIQFGHAVVDYGLKYGKDKDYNKWAKKDKTFIILNGGNLNTMTEAIKELKSLNIKYEIFQEPDLGNLLTSVVFLLPEEVWDTKKYPSCEDVAENENMMGLDEAYRFTFKEYYNKDEDFYWKVQEIRKFLFKFSLAN